MFLEVIVFIGAIILIVYISLYLVRFLKKQYQGAHAMYDLSVANQLVVPSSEFVWSSQPCSLRFAIFVNVSPKTVASVDCIATDPSASPRIFAPDCADYSFHACKCNGTDCGPCGLDASKSGYMTPLVKVGDYIQLCASGYTNQNDKSYVPALLKIRTGTDAGQHYMEAIPLPAIPLQKWTIVTIVKEGRRFDVYYGAKLQTSKMTQYAPIRPDSSQQIYAGSPGNWGGNIGMFMGFNRAFYAPDVLADIESIVDTRGTPQYESSLPSLPSMPTCLLGNCSNSLPDVKPPNQFMVYNTKYA